MVLVYLLQMFKIYQFNWSFSCSKIFNASHKLFSKFLMFNKTLIDCEKTTFFRIKPFCHLFHWILITNEVEWNLVKNLQGKLRNLQQIASTSSWQSFHAFLKVFANRFNSFLIFLLKSLIKLNYNHFCQMKTIILNIFEPVKNRFIFSFDSFDNTVY